MRVLACPAAHLTPKSKLAHDYAPDDDLQAAVAGWLIRRSPFADDLPVDRCQLPLADLAAACRSGMQLPLPPGCLGSSASAMAAAHISRTASERFSVGPDDQRAPTAFGRRVDGWNIRFATASLLEEAELDPDDLDVGREGRRRAASAASRAAVKNVLVLRVTWRTLGSEKCCDRLFRRHDGKGRVATAARELEQFAVA